MLSDTYVHHPDVLLPFYSIDDYLPPLFSLPLELLLLSHLFHNLSLSHSNSWSRTTIIPSLLYSPFLLFPLFVLSIAQLFFILGSANCSRVERGESGHSLIPHLFHSSLDLSLSLQMTSFTSSLILVVLLIFSLASACISKLCLVSTWDEMHDYCRLWVHITLLSTSFLSILGWRWNSSHW